MIIVGISYYTILYYVYEENSQTDHIASHHGFAQGEMNNGYGNHVFQGGQKQDVHEESYFRKKLSSKPRLTMPTIYHSGIRVTNARTLGGLLKRDKVSSIVIDASDEGICKTEEYVEFIKEAFSDLSLTSGFQVRA